MLFSYAQYTRKEFCRKWILSLYTAISLPHTPSYTGTPAEGRNTVTTEQKKAKILSAAATPFGAPDSIYWNEAKELRDAGLIVLAHKMGVRADKTRWVLA